MNIYAEKINEALVRIYSDDIGIEQELCTYFSFRPKGYQFVPSFKNKMWDGYIKLYSPYDKKLPGGLLPYVINYAKKLNYNVNLDDSLIDTGESIPIRDVINFVDSLNIHSNGKKIEVRDYQYDAIYQSINKRKLICQSPTSSGKSLIIYSLIRWALQYDMKILLMVPTTSLVEQMYTDFEDYSSEVNWNPSDYCHKLYAGKDKFTDHPILISTDQSLTAIIKRKDTPKNFFSQWDMVVQDEVHKAVAKTLKTISNKLVNCKYRIGTTGTVHDEKVNKLQLEGSFGPIYSVITTKELMDKKQVSNLKIKCLILEYDKEISKLMKNASYKEEIDYITTNEKRNKFIGNLCKATKGNTLVLFNYVENHGKPLFELIKNKCDDRPVFYISGETKTSTREDIRNEVGDYENAIIVASIATIATGTNIPSIENIIFAAPSKSKIRNLQSIGRGIRLKDGKTHCNLFDIADDISYKKRVNFTFNHFKERLDIYNNEQFDFTMTTIKI